MKTMQNLTIEFHLKGSSFQSSDESGIFNYATDNPAENSFMPQSQLGFSADEEVEEDELIEAFEQWYYDNSIEPEIDRLLSEIEKCDIVDKAERDGTSITIEYSANLSVLEKGNYTIEDWAENEPEAFDLDGQIEINVNPNGSFEKSSRTNVSDCIATAQSGGVTGYEIDAAFNYATDIVQYLECMVSEFQDYNGLQAQEPVRTLFVVHQSFHDAYNDYMLNIGKRDSDFQLYYYTDSNHVRHDEINHLGEAKWNKIEDYCSIMEEKEGIFNADLIEDWGSYMSGEEKEIITKALTEV